MGRKKKGKKKVEIDPSLRTSEEIYYDRLVAYVEEKLHQEVWDPEDQRRKDNKRKFTKKQKATQANKRAEQLKNSIETEKQRLIQEELERRAIARKETVEKIKQDGVQQAIRFEHLTSSCEYIDEVNKLFMEREEDDLMQAEWIQYLKCDGLPDPSNCGEMSTYLHLWDYVKDNTTIDQAAKKTEEVLYLLGTLEDFLDSPVIDEKQRNDWLSVAAQFRKYQQHNLDCAAYRLLRNIDQNLFRNDIKTATYLKIQEHFTICLWVLVQLPIPQFNPKRPKRPRQNLEFPDLNIQVLFPNDVDVWAMCVRAMYIPYDHLSSLSRSFDEPECPKILSMNLNESMQMEWEDRLEFAEIVLMPDKDVEKMRPPLPEDVEDSGLKNNVSSIYVTAEDKRYANIREELLIPMEPHEVNLRKYMIIGGVFFLDLFYQPPQALSLVLHDITISTLQVPKWLKDVPFIRKYEPPPPPEPGVTRKPEEIESELRKKEEAIDKLVLVSLSLPNNVMWLDVPVVCNWDSEKNIWTTENIHDVKHDEEKQTVNFKTGKFGPFAMAMYRFCNMPYQAWEIKPAKDGKVIVTIMAAVLIIEFTVENNMICVSQLQNAPNTALRYILGKYYKLPKLKKLLRQAGVDIFPPIDAFCYLKGVCEKHHPMETHLYYNIAQCSTLYNFAWSRWNLTAGRRKIIIQMREWPYSDRVKLPNYSMLMVTPLKARLIDCTEVSPVYCEEPMPKMKFYSDLHHLTLGIQTIAVTRKMAKVPMALVHTVAELLGATRICSFS